MEVSLVLKGSKQELDAFCHRMGWQTAESSSHRSGWNFSIVKSPLSDLRLGVINHATSHVPCTLELHIKTDDQAHQLALIAFATGAIATVPQKG